MNYKEALFFVGKCLTVTHEEHNRILIEKDLKAEKVDWDNVVKLSTEHYVFPALYCNLKRADFLHYLPNDLVDYMKHITDLNRERNQQIIKQAKEINQLLLKNNISPIFLKGTGNLLEGLYEDIAERMIGDIDLVFKKEEASKAYKILKQNNYKKIESTSIMPPNHRHYPRLVNEDYIAAVEIHKEILRDNYAKIFNYKSIEFNLKHKNEFCLLGLKHQLMLTILSKQINDYGYLLKQVFMRNFYDAFLFSKKIDTINSIREFSFFFSKANSFLALSSSVLNHPNSIKFEKNQVTKNYTLKSLSNLNKKKRLIKLSIFLRIRIPILFKGLYNKKYRKFILSRIKKLN
ncbi:putative nucleotidyltransferase-like protein [Lutibacter sp. Hel_I_33_5]|uniref:nucleotidyltransferase family protein n=1 Tax=Lutibacter sp. Hel_I_33_5 TaxID=1566289 RepID=UPI0011A8A848|nr:nucleotidyltransferase family protein [Lutibacter sp. Hel_I_33_5]TVZ56956.1 putative nucleotidyltransferase-like protein [Lutibacter sp. Hel_I_33_5]